MGFMRPKAARVPDPIDPNESMGEYLFGQDFKSNYQGITDPALQNRLIESERTYRPQYAALEMQDIATAARGGYGQPGLFDLLEEQSQRAGELQRSEAEKQRAADVGALQEYAPQVVEAYRQADPRSAELADLASQKAKEGLGLAEAGQELLGGSEQEDLLSKRGMELAASTGELTPLEKRRLEQQSRAGSLARGREMDSSSIYDEAQSRMAEELNKREREIALGSGLLGQQAGMRSQRMGLGAGLIGQEAAIGGQRLGQAFGMQRGMAGDVGMTLLGRPTQSIGLGGQVLGQSQGLASGPMGPQLFDPNVGINMALQQRGQDMSLMGINQQGKAQFAAARMGMLGSIGKGAMGAFG